MTIIEANKFYFRRGGAEHYLFETSASLESHGHTVFPFAMRHPSNNDTPYKIYFPSQVQTESVRFRPSSLKTVGRMFYSFEARRKIRALINAVKPDLCHLHNIYTQISPSILPVMKWHQVPMVMTVHDHHLVSPQYNVWAHGCGPDLQKAGLLRATFSRFHKNSLLASFVQAAAYGFHKRRQVYEDCISLFICPSEYIKVRMLASGSPEEKLRVIYFGTDPNKIRPRFDNDGYVLYAGRLSSEKGVETILQVAELIPDVHFKIAGAGPEEERLHRKGHGLPNVKFLGFKTGQELVE